MNDQIEPTETDNFDPTVLFQWYLEMGVDESIGDAPMDCFALTQELLEKRKQAVSQQAGGQTPKVLNGGAASPSEAARRSVQATDELVQAAVKAAQAAKTVGELKTAVEKFDGCPLKKTAMSTVFSDGSPDSPIMIVRQAPGKEDDREGHPFAGAEGAFLDKMLASAGLIPKEGDRSGVYVTNIVFWRPPGDRNLIASEVAVCLPFLERHIELVDPKILILLGDGCAKTVLGKSEGISKLRGKWFDHSTPNLSHPIATTALYAPKNLLGAPQQKRRTWNDLLGIRRKLETLK